MFTFEHNTCAKFFEVGCVKVSGHVVVSEVILLHPSSIWWQPQFIMKGLEPTNYQFELSPVTTGPECCPGVCIIKLITDCKTYFFVSNQINDRNYREMILGTEKTIVSP